MNSGDLSEGEMMGYRFAPVDAPAISPLESLRESPSASPRTRMSSFLGPRGPSTTTRPRERRPPPKLDQTSGESKAATMDTEFCLEGDLVWLKIEDVLFRVPQYQLVRHSETLEDMFNVPQGDGVDAPVEGRLKENPICFEGISANDFRNFLRPLFPFYSWRSTELSTVEWLSILKLSTMWYCLALRQSAVDALGPLLDDPMQKILLGREYFVVQWVQDGYRALVLRHETISDEEITEEGLGYPAGTKLLRMREQYWRSNSERGTAWLKTTASIDEHIKHVFKVELDGIRMAQTGYVIPCGSAPIPIVQVAARV
ncbi:unnamed protein product [Cyclocybe aegerita]|uniref:BTB domain-containing protein n=1 Tax=Cyclocybe aegerita TaxID=1973307 RepID=A0A8S0VQL8_CYCAE|nr:unnamed protein product [Cyclocybe aegerita]